MTDETQSLAPRTDRRRLLFGGAAAAVGAAAVAAAGRAHAIESRPGLVTDAPQSEAARQAQPFQGRYQAGIVTPRPAAGMIAAFDVVAETPADVERLFRLLTERFRFLTAGGPVPELDPKLPPADSGILGPVVAPDNLTMTLSLGASFFEKRAWLASFKPARLRRMTKFRNDALDADLCHGDLSVQICANTPDATIHALRDLIKSAPDLMVIRWKQEGTVPILPPRPDGTSESARNFLGFRDGSANPDSRDVKTMERIVWVGAEDLGEPAWAQGGSYQVVRIIRNLVERWDRTPLGEQERIIGRRKASGAPFDGRTEADAPDFSRDPDGAATPLDAHIRLANPRDAASQKSLILRRPFNYSNGVLRNGQLDQGMLFIAYQADLEAGFVAVQKRLDGEPLEEYVKPIGGGFFFTLPGVASETDFLGRALLEAATGVAKS